MHKGRSNFSRLKKFIALLKRFGLSVDINTEIENLDEPGILILTTRQKKFCFEDTDPELDYILNFVAKGNSLFHLSNHGNKPNTDLPDLTIKTRKLVVDLVMNFLGM